jgi:hypothetical protein
MVLVQVGLMNGTKGSGVLAAHPDVNGRAKALSGVDPPKNIVRGYVVLITDLAPAL